VFDALLQRLSLLGRQIRHLVFVVQCEQPELRATRPVVIDHPQTAALALGAARVAESHLAQAARTRDHLARLWVRHQGFLKATEATVIQVALAASHESRQFDEDRLHDGEHYTQVAYSRKLQCGADILASSAGPTTIVLAAHRPAQPAPCPAPGARFATAAEAKEPSQEGRFVNQSTLRRESRRQRL